jgi:antitoxin HicB
MTGEPFTEEELNAARRYPIVVRWSEDDQLYLASAPDLPGTTVHGETAAQAVEKSIEAVANWLSGMRSVGAAIPAPSPVPLAS